jgi:hypothetical protein
MTSQAIEKQDVRVVSMLNARTHFGKLLSIRDYVKLAAPEPEILRIIGEEAERSGASKLTSRQIDQIIRTTRAERKRQRA